MLVKMHRAITDLAFLVAAIIIVVIQIFLWIRGWEFKPYDLFPFAISALLLSVSLSKKLIQIELDLNRSAVVCQFGTPLLGISEEKCFSISEINNITFQEFSNRIILEIGDTVLKLKSNKRTKKFISRLKEIKN